MAKRLPKLPWKKALLGVALLVVLAGTGTFVYVYVRLSRVIDARLSGEIFNHASLVFSAPTAVYVGEKLGPEEVVSHLRKALYADYEGGSPVGSFRVVGSHLEIRPGIASFFQGEVVKEGPAVLDFHEGRIASIAPLGGGGPLESYQVEPEVITTVFDSSRTKRRLVHYHELPKCLIDAVVAAEDHQFFSHHGVNFYRIVASGLHDLFRSDEIIQGGSTLTMQLARNIFGLTPQRHIERKGTEIFLALLLEQRLTKEQILEMYANQIYLGQRGSFSIYGFGEAAGEYFNKDVRSLTSAEAALLAGVIRGPNFYSPYRSPTRALERRNFVLRSMFDLKMLSASDYETALHAPLGLVLRNVEGTQAPYFVEMVKDQLLSQFSEHDLLSQSFRIYTTLDTELQEAASSGVHTGIAEVDQELKKPHRGKEAQVLDPLQPQAALVALDPHTGWVKALVGGRDYGRSQLNHVLAKRQPGSSFKPFVYAAALSSGVDGSQPLMTPATTVEDEPTTFEFAGQTYEPENYKQEYHGLVTLRQALMYSMNVATVHVAEMTGYDKIRSLAIAGGINNDLLATPAIALGAYVATPLEIAGAYTIFSNGGRYVQPRLILAVNDASGHTLWQSQEVSRQVLDPRVAYLMVNLMESVINNGTGAGVRARGFTLPAAGKTGTSHDGWFAGFTSNLLAVVWVGYDDDRDIKLTGAACALPIWTDFMKLATQDPTYRNAQPFEAPPGIVTVPMQMAAHLDGGSDSVVVRNEYFIEGTEPQPPNPKTGLGGILSKLFHGGSASNPPPAGATPAPAAATPVPIPIEPASPTGVSIEQKKGNAVKRFFSIFKGRKPKPAASSDTEKTQPQE